MRGWELENPQNSNGFASSLVFFLWFFFFCCCYFCIWLAGHCCECIWLNNQKQTLWGWSEVPTSSSGPCAHTTETDWHLLQHSRIKNQNKNPAWFSHGDLRSFQSVVIFLYNFVEQWVLNMTCDHQDHVRGSSMHLSAGRWHIHLF